MSPGVDPDPNQDEDVADGFDMYFADFLEPPRWTVTGNAPDDVYRADPESFGNYEIEDAVVNAGFIPKEQCDSESGQFFCYPDTPEQGRVIGKFIQAGIDKQREKKSVWS